MTLTQALYLVVALLAGGAGALAGVIGYVALAVWLQGRRDDRERRRQERIEEQAYSHCASGCRQAPGRGGAR